MKTHFQVRSRKLLVESLESRELLSVNYVTAAQAEALWAAYEGTESVTQKYNDFNLDDDLNKYGIYFVALNASDSTTSAAADMTEVMKIAYNSTNDAVFFCADFSGKSFSRVLDDINSGKSLSAYHFDKAAGATVELTRALNLHHMDSRGDYAEGTYIIGLGTTPLTLDAGNQSRVFQIESNTLLGLGNVACINGKAPNTGGGNSDYGNNQSRDRGDNSQSSMTTADSGYDPVDSFSLVSGYGGGIYNHGTLIMSHSSVVNCVAEASWNVGNGLVDPHTDNDYIWAYGGGIYNAADATLVIANNSLISGNTALANNTTNADGTLGGVIAANARGGGIYNAGALEIRNSSVTYNLAEATVTGGGNTHHYVQVYAEGGGIYDGQYEINSTYVSGWVLVRDAVENTMSLYNVHIDGNKAYAHNAVNAVSNPTAGLPHRNAFVLVQARGGGIAYDGSDIGGLVIQQNSTVDNNIAEAENSGTARPRTAAEDPGEGRTACEAYGGGIYLETDKQLTITGRSSVSGNEVNADMALGGGILNNTNCTTTVENNSKIGYIYDTDGVTKVQTEITINRDAAHHITEVVTVQTKAKIEKNGTVTVTVITTKKDGTGKIISENTSTSKGLALSVYNDLLGNGNSAVGAVAHGGGIYNGAVRPRTAVSDSTIPGFNNANDRFPLIGASENITLTIKDQSVVSGNVANIGGGIYSAIGTGNTVEIVNSRLEFNTARLYGGAIYIQNGSQYTIIGDTFLGNHANIDGGAILSDAEQTITNTTFEQNSADHDGGAIYNTRVLTIANNTFTGNTAAHYGGAIANMSGKITITDALFDSNSVSNLDDTTPNADARGGAIFTQGNEDNTINYATFTNNKGYWGGAIHNGGVNTAGTLTLNNSILQDNNAREGGAVMNMVGSTLSMSTDLVTNNTAGHGAGLYNAGAAELIFVTIANNTASNAGGGIYMEGDASKDTDGTGLFHTLLYNSIVLLNTGAGNQPSDIAVDQQNSKARGAYIGGNGLLSTLAEDKTKNSWAYWHSDQSTGIYTPYVADPLQKVFVDIAKRDYHLAADYAAGKVNLAVDTGEPLVRTKTLNPTVGTSGITITVNWSNVPNTVKYILQYRKQGQTGFTTYGEYDENTILVSGIPAADYDNCVWRVQTVWADFPAKDLDKLDRQQGSAPDYGVYERTDLKAPKGLKVTEIISQFQQDTWDDSPLGTVPKTTVTVSWSEVPGVPRYIGTGYGYVLQWRKPGQTNFEEYNNGDYAIFYDPLLGTCSVTDVTLELEGKYEWRVCALFSTTSHTGWSQVYSVTKTQPPSPTEFSVKSQVLDTKIKDVNGNNTYDVTLQWTAQTGANDEFVLYYRLHSQDDWYADNTPWMEYNATIPGTAREITLKGLSANCLYEFRLLAVNEWGRSREESFVKGEDTPAPLGSTYKQASSDDGGTAVLVFRDSVNDLTFKFTTDNTLAGWDAKHKTLTVYLRAADPVNNVERFTNDEVKAAIEAALLSATGLVRTLDLSGITGLANRAYNAASSGSPMDLAFTGTAVNGLTFGFTNNEHLAGWFAATKTLIVYLPADTKLTDAEVKAAVEDALLEAGIVGFELDESGLADSACHDALTGGRTAVKARYGGTLGSATTNAVSGTIGLVYGFRILPLAPKLEQVGNAPDISYTLDDKSITLSWNPQDGLTKYEIQYKLANSTTWETVWVPSPTRTMTTIVIDGLLPNTSYDVRIRAYNKAGTSSWSNILHAKTGETGTKSNVPAAVTGLTAVFSSNTSATVSWNSSGSAVTYEVRYRFEDNSPWSSPQSVSGVNEWLASALLAGKSYLFQVRAVNANGVSDWAEYRLLKPEKPTDFRQTSFDKTSVTLTWSYNGKSDSVTGFELTYTYNGEAVTKEIDASVRSYRVEGLPADAEVAFTVVAINNGARSDVTSAMYQIRALQAATNVYGDITDVDARLTVGKETSAVTLSFIVPGNNVIGTTKYTITIFNEQTGKKVKTVTVTSTKKNTTQDDRLEVNITGLKAGTKYRFEVSAKAGSVKVNGKPQAMKASGVSDPSNVIETYRKLPAASISKKAAAASSLDIKVKNIAKLNADGDTLTIQWGLTKKTLTKEAKFTLSDGIWVAVQDSDVTFDGTYISICNLSSVTKYYVSVSFSGTEAVSAKATVISATTLRAPFPAPANFSLISRSEDGSAELEWTANGNDAGLPAKFLLVATAYVNGRKTEIKKTVTVKSAEVEGSNWTYTLSGLKVGVEYTLTLYAVKDSKHLTGNKTDPIVV